ncbi:MAG TPA: hypothetical protein PK765_06030 [bacterium]|nr:hypothetical protein [bacterium]
MERFIRESVAGNDEKPDAIRRGIIQWMKATPATMSGVIDATLDTTQSGIDLAVAPDKVLENVRNFVQGLSSEFLDTLLHDMTNEAEFSDFVYATSYVVTVFAVGLRLGPEL